MSRAAALALVAVCLAGCAKGEAVNDAVFVCNVGGTESLRIPHVRHVSPLPFGAWRVDGRGYAPLAQERCEVIR